MPVYYLNIISYKRDKPVFGLLPLQDWTWGVTGLKWPSVQGSSKFIHRVRNVSKERERERSLPESFDLASDIQPWEPTLQSRKRFRSSCAIYENQASEDSVLWSYIYTASFHILVCLPNRQKCYLKIRNCQNPLDFQTEHFYSTSATQF